MSGAIGQILVPNLYKVAAQPTRLTHSSGGALTPQDWPPGTNEIFVNQIPQLDIGVLSLKDETIKTVVATSSFEREATLSPDGRWLAYSTDQSGRWEVVIRPYPNVEDDLILVSTKGGYQAEWSPDGDELFYINGPNLMSVSFDDSKVGAAAKLLDLSGTTGNYSISPDGEQFLIARYLPLESLPHDRIVIVPNFADEVRRRLDEADNR